MDLIAPDAALLPYNYVNFAHAKNFVFRMWCELAVERRIERPDDLSGACIYGSLFVRRVFGGSIEGSYVHQFNRVSGRLVDLSHDARDVGRMRNPYAHESEYFDVPEYQARQQLCVPRVERWAEGFVLELG